MTAVVVLKMQNNLSQIDDVGVPPGGIVPMADASALEKQNNEK